MLAVECIALGRGAKSQDGLYVWRICVSLIGLDISASGINFKILSFITFDARLFLLGNRLRMQIKPKPTLAVHKKRSVDANFRMGSH